MSGHASLNMASSGRPMSSPTLSYGSRGPSCAAMTEFMVSTTRRTLSVSVPSRSQRTARRFPLATATTRLAGDHRLGADGQHDLLRDSPIARLLADAHEGRELVVERVEVLDAPVADFAAWVTWGVRLQQRLL